MSKRATLVLILFMAACGGTGTGKSAFDSEPNEPCEVTAPEAARAAANNWCQGGVFTKVAVSTDGNNFVATLQFSQKGYRGYEGNKAATLAKFRALADQMVAKAQLNVAFSLYDTDGQMIGGCARSVRQADAICK